jgi:hypothetical protein
MPFDIAQALELSQHVVGRLLGQPCCDSDLAWSTPVHAGEPEERDHRRGHVRVPGGVDARQHLGPSEVVREPKTADGARRG